MFHDDKLTLESVNSAVFSNKIWPCDSYIRLDTVMAWFCLNKQIQNHTTAPTHDKHNRTTVKAITYFVFEI